jgi:hypothetical protein
MDMMVCPVPKDQWDLKDLWDLQALVDQLELKEEASKFKPLLKFAKVSLSESLNAPSPSFSKCMYLIW